MARGEVAGKEPASVSTSSIPSRLSRQSMAGYCRQRRHETPSHPVRSRMEMTNQNRCSSAGPAARARLSARMCVYEPQRANREEFMQMLSPVELGRAGENRGVWSEKKSEPGIEGCNLGGNICRRETCIVQKRCRRREPENETLDQSRCW